MSESHNQYQKHQGQRTPSDTSDSYMSGGKHNPLPPSSEKNFWGDAAIELSPVEKPQPSSHKFDWVGGYAVCTTCAYQHTIPITRHTHRLVDGLPVTV